MTSAQEFAAALRAPELDDAWWRCLDGLQGLPVAEQEEAQNSVAALRDRFLAVLDDVDDPDEHEGLTAVFYALVRAQWALYNHQSGYQLADGRVDRTLFCRSGMLSAMLGQLEAVLDPADTAAICGLLAQPVSRQRAAPSVPDETARHAGSPPANDEDGADSDPVWPVPDAALQAEAARLSGEVEALRSLVRVAQSERDALERELDAAREDRRRLEDAFGVADAPAVIRHVEDMRERLSALEGLQALLGGLDSTAEIINF